MSSTMGSSAIEVMNGVEPQVTCASQTVLKVFVIINERNSTARQHL